MAAHNRVCSGVRRRIGEGKSTLIWGYPWLPDDPSPMVQTPMPANLNGSLVSGLIDEERKAWDLYILSDIFTPADVERISRIPISPRYEDSWYWFGDPRGCYSVESGYRSIIGDYASLPNTFDNWNLMWKLKVPPKWKMFLWGALTNVLPVTMNLLLKKVEVDPTCPMCGLIHEDTMHALVLCDYVQLVWNESHLSTPTLVDTTFNLWFVNVLTAMSEEDVCLAVAVLYHLWRARNNAVWDGFLPAPRRVMVSAASTLHAWRAANYGQLLPLHQTETGSTPTTGQHGQQPTLMLPRCLFDAGYHLGMLKASFGAVLLVEDGGFLAACAGPLPDCFSPFMAEAAACWFSSSSLTRIFSLIIDVFFDADDLPSSDDDEEYLPDDNDLTTSFKNFPHIPYTHGPSPSNLQVPKTRQKRKRRVAPHSPLDNSPIALIRPQLDPQDLKDTQGVVGPNILTLNSDLDANIMNHPRDTYFGVHILSMQLGLRFPLHSFLIEFLNYYEIVPGQLVLNGYQAIVGFLSCHVFEIRPIFVAACTKSSDL
ncbi:uncharacterized protein LOC116029703 [Ipomoea triloba]|uniref:uncharacterized protein LOC116029703 n=1 Tax=Ipomoea triloba TaxID=35885 RepID=UPI00125E7966|nr:uncharacterized protein LOC116029703 [Ipomoea triloba]